LIALNFYRQVTYLDLNAENEKYLQLLSPTVRGMIEQQEMRAKVNRQIRSETNCSLQETNRLLSEYETFLAVLEDFKKGKEIFTDY